MGIHDRHYMRHDAGFGLKLKRALARASAAQWAVFGIVVAGVVQFVCVAAGQARFVRDNFAMSLPGLKAGKVWETLTYAFVHADIWHLLINSVGLWFLGRGVAEESGSRKFWTIFGGGVLAGSLAWSALWSLPVASGALAIEAGRSQEALVGASAGVFALMAYFMADKLKEEFRILIFFVLPATLEGYWILGLAAIMSAGGLLLTEIPLATGYWPVVLKDFSMCHSAHFAGLAFGYLWRLSEIKPFKIRALHRRARLTVVPKTDAPRSATPTREAPAQPQSGAAPEGAENLRAEVDRILDKINARGFGALSPEERDVLEKARETLKR